MHVLKDLPDNSVDMVFGSIQIIMLELSMVKIIIQKIRGLYKLVY